MATIQKNQAAALMELLVMPGDEHPYTAIELQNLPEIEYPEEVVQRWQKEVEIAKNQLATGELIPKSIAEYAADFGISMDDIIGNIENDR
ncbi:MAG: hypothetical protein LBC70_02015 [Chitinispirillales bacterium]|jgi:hypothetical protein|nr:hypothetical protein [Chitinispirillales bacterium]